MSGLWPWWIGAVGLALVSVAHFWGLGASLGVSGRYSRVVDRLRGQRDDEEMSPAELAEALRRATAAQFGTAAPPLVQEVEAPRSSLSGCAPTLSSAGSLDAVVFLVAVLGGGALAAAVSGRFDLTATLASPRFASLVDALAVPAPVVLVAGGVLVGFGTRMAGGCTSGHGLTGTSQLQIPSLLATAAFFGCGIGVSLLLGGLL